MRQPAEPAIDRHAVAITTHVTTRHKPTRPFNPARHKPMPDATPPSTEFIYKAEVDIADRRSLGTSALGERLIVDILGGHFEGPRLRGRVLPGGADRQLLRPDGVKELHALYEMQTDDGTVLTVDNRVVVDESVQPERYARSCVAIRAPAGPYEWLNRRVFVGTLASLGPSRKAVAIRVYMLT
ncbi:MAG: DUF3237 family protein [Rhodoferax sp.]|jgi:hypothetical protein|nr:DUF3237 family protein [Rhodoferax sp.]